MTDIRRVLLSVENGWWPAAALTGPRRVPNSTRALSRNFWILNGGLTKSAKGLGGALAGQVGNTQLYLVGSQIGAMSAGSVIPYRGGLYLWVGIGAVTIDGTQIGTGGSGILYNPGTDPLNAKPLGLDFPGPPDLEEGAAGKNSGSYAAQITRVRTVTGGESIGSGPSAPISVKNKKIKVRFPGALSSQDKWGLYFTAKGRGTTGPFLFLKDINEADIDPSTRQVEVDFYDSELGALEPPTDYNPPPPCKFVASLGPVVIGIGSFEGNGIAAGISPSAANKIDGYPALYTAFLNPLESVIGFAARPTDGELLLWTNNSLQALVFTGSSSFPILPRPLWPTTGIQSKHGGCFAESIFYGYAGKAGPVRLAGDDPDTEFARAVIEFIRNENWDPAAVVVGYDRIRNAVVFMGSGTNGPLAFPFMRDDGIWSPAIVLSGAPQACVSVNGQLKIAIGGSLYDWEAGNGGAWALYPDWKDEPQPADRKTVVGYTGVVNTAAAPVTVDLLLDLSDTPVVGDSQTSTGSGDRTLDWQPLNELCKQFTLKISGNGPDHRVDYMEMEIFHEPGIRNVI
jgi:hypothetical protein